jgi:xylan 1,4-beta-xylosidase
MAATFYCDLSGPGIPFPHFWEHTVGSDHAPMALRSDWQRQLRRCHDELGFQYVRFHGLLSDDVGVLVQHNGRLLLSFFNVDQIFDFLLSIGMRPFIELSFMPAALASGDRTVFHYRGNVTPPRSPRLWAELIRALVSHLVKRYGAREVRQWFFEVWNEPNLKAFWTGTQAGYFQLYRHTVEAIKSVDPSLKVGGPATAKNEWIEEFLGFCSRHRLPVDFVSTHHYPTDPFAETIPDTSEQLSLSWRSILREQAQDARARCKGKPLYYTEWNSSSDPRDPLHDEPYAAAFAIKTVMEARGLVQGYSFWTFTDIFEENYLPSKPFHGGFGLLTLHGIPKPTYRAFELLHRLGSQMLLVDGAHATVDAWVVRRKNGVSVLLTNHALPRHAMMLENVRVFLTGAPEPRAARVERIDDRHANPKGVWLAMGGPEYLDGAAIGELEAASQLEKERQRWRYRRPQVIELELDLPEHAVAVVTVEFSEQPE